MRRVVHLGVAASVVLAFAMAPFAHRHEGDPEHGHGRGEVHAHWPGDADHQEPEGPGWEAYDGDSDARTADWLAGDGKSAAPAQVAVAESKAMAAPTAGRSDLAELTPRNHGPPGRLHTPSRAPPA